jgi:hypothetical protein
MDNDRVRTVRFSKVNPAHLQAWERLQNRVMVGKQTDGRYTLVNAIVEAVNQDYDRHAELYDGNPMQALLEQLLEAQEKRLMSSFKALLKDVRLGNVVLTPPDEDGYSEEDDDDWDDLLRGYVGSQNR